MVPPNFLFRNEEVTINFQYSYRKKKFTISNGLSSLELKIRIFVFSATALWSENSAVCSKNICNSTVIHFVRHFKFRLETLRPQSLRFIFLEIFEM